MALTTTSFRRLSWLLCPVLVLKVCTGQPFGGCTVEEYYADVDDPPPRAQLEALLARRHRQLPYTDQDGDDVWKALTDIDAGETPNSVRLIYRQVDIAADLAGDTVGWNREHLWPKSRGVEDSGKDVSDIHHLVPSDWNVNAARGNKLFGACPEDLTCTRPAATEAAADTAASPLTFLPPVSVRGMIARALFYMDVRYSGSNNDPDLRLSDCQLESTDDNMGYLSELLEWHDDYQVTASERLRNDQVCERWQGNRNPFVDHPEWVSILMDRSVSDCSATSSPTPAGAVVDTACAQPGDIMIIGVNSDNPDTVAMVALKDLPAFMPLYLTDNGWTGSAFRANEGTVRLHVPANGISAGTVFGYGESSSVGEWAWETVSGSFALSASGDTVLLYCIDNDKIFHVAGISLAGAWDSSVSDTSQSVLPSELASVAVALDHTDNSRYDGPREGSALALQASIGNVHNWTPNNSVGFTDFPSFTVLPSSDNTDAPYGITDNALPPSDNTKPSGVFSPRLGGLVNFLLISVINAGVYREVV
jgi:endonuclease I